MAKKELYLYSTVYDFTAVSLIAQMEDAKNDDVLLRMNTNGGDPQAAYGIIAKMNERKASGKKTDIQVDGKAFSSGLFMLPFGSTVTALNVSSFVLHRAAFPEWYEPTIEEKAMLAQLNLDLRAAFENKIDPLKFAAVSGVTMDQVFDENTRIDVILTAAQALEIGLVDNVININDSQIAANSKVIIFDDSIAIPKAESKAVQTENKTKINNIMDKEKLKAEFPSVYAAIENAGITAENERVKSWMVFHDVDAKAVAEGIESGKDISPSKMAELTRKSISAEILGKVAKEAPAAVTAEGADKTAKENEIASFEAAVQKELGLKF